MAGARAISGTHFAISVCLVVLLVGVCVGRFSKRATNITIIQGGAERGEEFDARDFNMGPAEPPPDPTEDPAEQWQRYFDGELQASAGDPPEDQPQMVRRGVTTGSMVPARVSRATSEWGAGMQMQELGSPV
jgi:hypothetical protein